jgi:hypothetical protein
MLPKSHAIQPTIAESVPFSEKAAKFSWLYPMLLSALVGLLTVWGAAADTNRRLSNVEDANKEQKAVIEKLATKELMDAKFQDLKGDNQITREAVESLRKSVEALRDAVISSLSGSRERAR